MMKNLLLSLFFVLPVLVSAQRSLPADAPELVRPARTPTLAKVATDTLFPEVLLDDCYQFIAPFFIADTGFVLGSNIYGDVLQLQRIENPGSGTLEIEALEVFMTLADSNDFQLPFTAIVLDDVDANGRPTRILGSSDTLLASQFNRDTTGSLVRTTEFTFSEPVEVTGSSFLIGINFSGAYTETSVSFIGLYGTNLGCGDGDNVVQGSLGQNNLIFGTFAGYYGQDLEIPMFVAVTEVSTGLSGVLTTNYGARVAPNPVSDQLRLRFQPVTSTGTYSVQLTDQSGRQLRTADFRATTAEIQVDWSLASLPAGLYFYHIDGPEGRQSGKVIKR